MLREAQIKMCKILEYVEVFCKDNNIEYWLDYGTLLGAVRHEGFIPWDDDIDLGMDRKNYEKFYNLFSKISKKESYFCEKLDKDYLKVKLKNNYILKTNGEKEELNIEIFPYDYYDPKIISLLNKQSYYYSLKRVKSKNIKDILKNNFIRLQRKYYKKFVKGKLEKQIKKGTLKEIGKNCYMGLGLETNMMIIGVDSKIIFPLKELKFEGKFYRVPNNCSEYLTLIYGNYMKLPPIEDRHGHPEVKNYILEKN